MVESRDHEARRLFERMRGISVWLDEALEQEGAEAFACSYAPLDGDERADVCIVGGGFLGLWTAIRLKQAAPDLAVTIVEKTICGAGASGRNGGFVLSWWAKFTTLEKLYGSNQAIWLAKASEAAVDEVGAFCAEAGIGGHFRKSGWLWSSTGTLQDGSWEPTLQALQRHALPVLQPLAPDEVARLAGSERHRCGVFEASAATVQPALLARALAAKARALGVTLHEGSPLRALQRGRPAVVRCERGQVTAPTVILAMNAWGIGLPELRRSVAVVSSDIVASRALPEWFARGQPWGDGLAISDSRALVHYYRATPGGRIVFGKGVAGPRLPFAGRVGEAFDGPSLGVGLLQRNARWMYPTLPQDAWATNWMGPIDKSMTGLPSLGALPGHANILYGIGFSGNGVGPTALCSRVLASLALGRRDEWSGCQLVVPPPVDFPSEPFRYLGGQLVRSAMVRKERSEDRGRPAGALVAKLASFAPAALSPTKSDSH